MKVMLPIFQCMKFYIKKDTLCMFCTRETLTGVDVEAIHATNKNDCAETSANNLIKLLERNEPSLHPTAYESVIFYIRYFTM